MTKEKITCEICGETFKDKSGLAGHMHGKHPEALMGETAPEEVTAPVPVKKGQSPLERLIQELKVPRVVNGQAEVFDAGVEYGVRSVLVGVRVAQELSAMGVQQAVPIIKMAQEMREAEGQAAKIIAAELAGATLEGNKDLRSAISQLGNQMQVSGPNPFASMMAGVMQPVLGQVMQTMLGTFFGGQSPASQPGAAADSGSNATIRAGTEVPVGPTPGIEEHDINDWEE